MADFVAVLRKTIDGLGEATPQTRARVYDKARATISAKLAAMSPAPAPAVIDRQKKMLEDAIASLEAEYAAAAQPKVEVDDLDELMEQLSRPDALKPAPSPAAARPAASPKPDPAAPRPEPLKQAPIPTPASDLHGPEHEIATPEPKTAAPERSANVNAPRPAPTRSRNGARGARIAVALIALAFAGSAAYAVWLNRDEVSAMLGIDGEPAVAEAPQPAAPAQEEPEADSQDMAAAEPAPEPAPAEQAPAPKFTQKLNEDGSETDPGPAGGTDSLGEGTSVAAVTTPPSDPAGSDAAAPAAPDAAAQQAASPAETTPQAPASEAIAVGQRAIFYEERTSADQQTAEQGSIVWSLVQESPGNDQPPEPAIRGEATIPGKDIQLRMTIRRNADETLPASHIVELIFLTPENFDGGVIDNVLRMTMKQTEEATGSPLLGIPAKIGDGFFLIALSDGAPETEANLQLMRRMNWIDIPVVYRSGRRALITMERGLPGGKVFEDALKDWQAKSG